MAERVSRIDPERGADHSTTCGERAPSPPDVERRDVSVPDAFFATGVCADFLDGEIHLDQAFGVLVPCFDDPVHRLHRPISSDIPDPLLNCSG